MGHSGPSICKNKIIFEFIIFIKQRHDLFEEPKTITVFIQSIAEFESIALIQRLPNLERITADQANVKVGLSVEEEEEEEEYSEYEDEDEYEDEEMAGGDVARPIMLSKKEKKNMPIPFLQRSSLQLKAARLSLP